MEDLKKWIGKKFTDFCQDDPEDEREIHYEELRQYGGTDPFWPDGVNMNLCRNHIIYLRKQIEQELKPEYYPEEYCMVIPKEVDPEYQAAYKRDNLKKADIILKKEISVPKLKEGQLTIWDFIGGQER